MGFKDRLAGMRSKQEAGDSNKAAEAAAEKAREQAESAAAEVAERRGELDAERESAMAAFESANEEADGAEGAIAEAEAFAAEMGENLDPEAAAEIDAIKAEAGELLDALEQAKAELERINVELASLDSGEGVKTGHEETRTPEAGLDELPEQNPDVPEASMNLEQAYDIVDDAKWNTASKESPVIDDEEANRLLEAATVSMSTDRIDLTSGVAVVLARHEGTRSKFIDLYMERQLPKFGDLKAAELDHMPEGFNEQEKQDEAAGDAIRTLDLNLGQEVLNLRGLLESSASINAELNPDMQDEEIGKESDSVLREMKKVLDNTVSDFMAGISQLGEDDRDLGLLPLMMTDGQSEWKWKNTIQTLALEHKKVGGDPTGLLNAVEAQIDNMRNRRLREVAKIGIDRLRKGFEGDDAKADV
ncbi:hypothetical protein HOI83_02595 [Candidatus Uhrbacteria bacterium]|jgi:hypothetical protein|nr:hypothetical protein [Candidatus Uhrbacteria bacterium]